MHTFRLCLLPLSLVLGLTLIVSAAVMSWVSPALAATTGAGFSGITPYGGYLGNYIAPDGTRVYCIDSDRDWPNGATSPGVIADTLSTGWGAALSAETVQKFNYALAHYGQTDDPVQAAAMSAYLYAYTSGYARHHGASYDAGLHYINGNGSIATTYATIWADAESQFAATPAPTAVVSIDMIEPLVGVVEVQTTPEGVAGTLTLEGAVVAESSATSIDVVGGERVEITGSPAPETLSYTIAANASFRARAGWLSQVTLYTTGDQQRTIRDAGPAQVDFAAQAVLDVALPPAPPEPEVPTLAETGADPAAVTGMLGAGLALVTAGALVTIVRRSREYAGASRVVPHRE